MSHNLTDDQLLALAKDVQEQALDTATACLAISMKHRVTPEIALAGVGSALLGLARGLGMTAEGEAIAKRLGDRCEKEVRDTGEKLRRAMAADSN